MSGTVTVNSAASDNVGVTKVEFYIKGVLRATTLPPPTPSAGIPPQRQTVPAPLTSKAYDAAGNVGQSANVSVTVSNSVTPSGSYTAVFGNASGANYPNTVQDTFININSDVNATRTELNTYTWPQRATGMCHEEFRDSMCTRVAGLRVNAPLKPTRRLRRQLVTSRCTSDRHRVEMGSLDDYIAGARDSSVVAPPITPARPMGPDVSVIKRSSGWNGRTTSSRVVSFSPSAALRTTMAPSSRSAS